MNLREIYHELGEFHAKFIIDPRESSDIDNVVVRVLNSDGVLMQYEAKRWGTKINVSFLIDSATPDGVGIIDITLDYGMKKSVRERFSFWTVK